VENNRIELIVTDVDGTLTDGGVYYSTSGDRSRRFSTYDGHGFEIAREHGIETLLMTRSDGMDIYYRARHLGVVCYSGIIDKRRWLQAHADANEIDLKNACFMGNDITDLEAMQLCGYSACPSDAHGHILTQCSGDGFTSVYNGGYGAFRQLIDWLVLWDFKKVPYPDTRFIAGSK